MARLHDQIEAGDVSGIEVLRRAVKLLNSNNETFNGRFTAVQLIALARACWASDWDIWPDQWSDRQVVAAIVHGTPPDFRDDCVTPKEPPPCGCEQCEKVRGQIIDARWKERHG